MKDRTLKEGIQKNNLVLNPFERKYSNEELEEGEGERLTIRINPQERARINYLKEVLEYGSDGTVIKLGLGVLENVIRNQLGEEFIRKIAAQNRRRPPKASAHN